MAFLKMGVIGTSKNEDERHMSIHPEHLKRLPDYISGQLIIEIGYGEHFNTKVVVIARKASLSLSESKTN